RCAAVPCHRSNARWYCFRGWRAETIGRSHADRTAAPCSWQGRTADGARENNPRPARHAKIWRAYPSGCRILPNTRDGHQRCAGSHVNRSEFPDTSGLATEDKVPYTMAQTQPSSFKLRLWAKVRPWCVTLLYGVFQSFFTAKDFQHLLGVVFPVGCQMNVRARFHAAGQQLYQRWLDQTTLVVPLLGPRVRKVNVHARQGIRSNH